MLARIKRLRELFLIIVRSAVLVKRIIIESARAVGERIIFIIYLSLIAGSRKQLR